jgi:hypothetical protein
VPARPAAAEPAVPEPAAAPRQPAFVVPLAEEAGPAPAAAPPAVPASPEPASVPAPEPTPAIQPGPAAGDAHRLTVRLTNGERVEVGAYDELDAATAAAKALMGQVAAADGGDWPLISGRFLKPDAIVSVDIS